MNLRLFAWITSLLIIAALLTSCNCSDCKTETASAVMVSVDSLDNVWNKAWNSQNVEAISNLFTENAVLIAGEWKVTGKDSLTENWIKSSAPAISNLRLMPYQQNVSSTLAYSSGAYTHDVSENGSITGSQRGVYTIIWEARSEKIWKVSLVQIQVSSDVSSKE